MLKQYEIQRFRRADIRNLASEKILSAEAFASLMARFGAKHEIATGDPFDWKVLLACFQRVAYSNSKLLLAWFLRYVL